MKDEDDEISGEKVSNKAGFLGGKLSEMNMIKKSSVNDLLWEITHANSPTENLNFYVLKDGKIRIVLIIYNEGTRQFLGPEETIKLINVMGVPLEVFL